MDSTTLALPRKWVGNKKTRKGKGDGKISQNMAFQFLNLQIPFDEIAIFVLDLPQCMVRAKVASSLNY